MPAVHSPGGLRPQLASLPYINTVYEYPAFLRLVKAADGVDYSGLSAASLTNKGNIFTGLYLKVKVFKDDFALLIPEGNVIKLHSSSIGPNFPFSG